VEFEHYNAQKSTYLALDSTGGLKSLNYQVAMIFPQVVYILSFLRWVLVLMNFLPISLMPVLSIVKYLQSSFVTWDVCMNSVSKGIEPKVHNYRLAEELGQVSYVLTDKTGTLT
jgi:magnesium-transporting ATPase (P-type)